jgi:hypothetical protein
MNKNSFLSILLIFSLFLPVVISFVETIDDTVLSYDLCQENQTEEEESEEKEGNNELEAFLLNDLFVPFYFNCDIFGITSKKPLYINVNSEILTPPPQIG